ncbi:MAG: ABC transporter substrate-binding protein [Ilumatobacteraceae bacterium]
MACPTVPPLPSRRRVSLAALIMSAALFAACGDDDDSATDGVVGSASTSAGSAATSPGARDGTAGGPTAAAFPVTVAHEHGETEVVAAPERIVTLGYSDQDFVLAFGVAPIAVTHWYGDDEHGTWEWAQDELGDAEPVVLNQGAFTGTAAYNYEQIAGLDPDLIIALYTDMSAEQYDTLTAIAPTIAPSGEYPEFGMPWQETTRTVGLALGQPERAEALIAEVDAQLADAAAAHPEFEGLEVVVAELFEPGSSFARSATDPRTTLMTSLGFVLPDEIAELAGDLDGAPISDEQMALLDRDLLLWNVGHDPELRAQIEAKPLYDQLEVVQAGHSVFIEDPLVSGALTWGTVLSLPYAIDELVPMIADALAG